MRMHKLSGSAAAAVAILLTGCSDTETPIAKAVEGEQEIKFDFNLSAAFSQKVYHDITPTESRAAINAKAEMQIYDEISGEYQTLDWFVTLDNDVATITSNSTAMLAPSTYSFTLRIYSKGSYYFGEADNIVISDGEEALVDLTVKPVIGGTNLYYSMGTLPSLSFQYASEDISSFTDPKIGYIVDGSVEQIVELNASGASDVYLNIPEGEHTVSLKLYDGNVQKAKSNPIHEDIVVASGEELKIDLIPLAGEMKLNLPVEKGSGYFYIRIPEEIVTEVGGISNLKSILQITGSKIPPQSTELIFTKSGSYYYCNTSIDSLLYDTVDMSVTFLDKSQSDEVIATMVYSDVVLSAQSFTDNSAINLINRNVITGDLLSSIGVNVFDTAGTAVKGASIYVDGQLVGITGDAAVWGTDGYLKFHQKKGTVTVSAEHPSYGVIASKVITVESLGVYNITLSSDTLSSGSGAIYAISSLDNMFASLGNKGMSSIVTEAEDRIGQSLYDQRSIDEKKLSNHRFNDLIISIKGDKSQSDLSLLS